MRSVCLVWCTESCNGSVTVQRGQAQGKAGSSFKSGVGTKPNGYKLATCSVSLESRRRSLSMREGFGASSQSGESWPNTYWCKMELTTRLRLTWAAVSALQLQMPPPSQSTAHGHVILTLYTFLLQNVHYLYVVFCYYVWFGTYYELHHKLHRAAYICILRMITTKEY